LYDIVVGYKFLVKFSFLLASIDLFNMNLYQTFAACWRGRHGATVYQPCKTAPYYCKC